MMVEVIESAGDQRVYKTELWAGDFVDRGSVTAVQKKASR
jgi:hypothetical protein